MSRPVWHDPLAVQVKGFDWYEFLARLDSAALTPGPGITIVASTWAVSAISGDAAPLTLSGGQVSEDGLKTIITIAGGTGPAGPPGTLGSSYWVTNHITTSSGVQDERSFEVQVVQR